MAELEIIQDKIYEVRGQRVMLDRDLAELYGVETKALNQAVKRNQERFMGNDFMFQLTLEECNSLVCCSRSQFVTLNTSRGHNIKYTPYAFTEQGVAMLSSVLRSKTAIEVNRGIIRTFVQMRSYLAAHPTEPLALPARMDELERRLALLEQSRPLQLPAARRPLPEKLSEGVSVWIYSERALLILTEDKDDERLLNSIGARHNHWLTLHGEQTAGWVFPHSRLKTLEKYLPEKSCK